MGPLIFCVYTLPLGRIIFSHNIQFHIYADDTQLICPFSISNPQPSLHKLEQCVCEIRSWMLKKQLKINDDKTEFLVLTKASQQHIASNYSLDVGLCNTNPSTDARNLGVMFDSTMSMDKQISNICRGVHHQLRRIESIRQLLSTEATEMIIHSVVSSRLDYCKALLYGLSSCKIQRLQSLQNTAARIVSKSKKHEHITPILVNLHWLPVRQRILYKILLLTFKALNSLAPEYISILVTTKKTVRSLRSNNKMLLELPSSKLKTYGDRSFKVAAANEWNNLPLFLRTIDSLNSFKAELKTYLFKKCYNV